MRFRSFPCLPTLSWLIWRNHVNNVRQKRACLRKLDEWVACQLLPLSVCWRMMSVVLFALWNKNRPVLTDSDDCHSWTLLLLLLRVTKKHAWSFRKLGRSSPTGPLRDRDGAHEPWLPSFSFVSWASDSRHGSKRGSVSASARLVIRAQRDARQVACNLKIRLWHWISNAFKAITSKQILIEAD